MWKPIVAFCEESSSDTRIVKELLRPFVEDVGGELFALRYDGSSPDGSVEIVDLLSRKRLIAVVCSMDRREDWWDQKFLKDFADTHSLLFIDLEQDDSEKIQAQLLELQNLVSSWSYDNHPLGTESARDEQMLIRTLMLAHDAFALDAEVTDSPVDDSGRLALEAMRMRLTPIELWHENYDRQRLKRAPEAREFAEDELTARRLARKIRKLPPDERFRFAANVFYQIGIKLHSDRSCNVFSVSKGHNSYGFAVADETLAYHESRDGHDLAKAEMRFQLEMLDYERARLNLAEFPKERRYYPITGGYVISGVPEIPVRVALVYQSEHFSSDDQIPPEYRKKMQAVRDLLFGKGFLPIDSEGYIYGEP